MTSMLCPVLVGREADLETLRDRLDAAHAGAGGVVLVTGDPGVGKSRLLREVRDEAIRSGALTLTGRAVDRAATPFRPLVEVLLGLDQATPAGTDRSDPFDGVLSHVVEGSAAPEARTAATAPLVIGEALTRVLAGAGSDSEGACVLVLLEDLHWADLDTLAVVEYLADHLTSAPVLCVAALRSGEVPAADAWARDLQARGLAAAVEIRPLRADEVIDMAVACLGGDGVPHELRSFLVDRSEGVPLVVEELLAGLVSDDALSLVGGRWKVVSRLAPRVPVTLAESVRRRIDALGPDTARVVRAAAVLGRAFDWRLLGPVSGLPEADVLVALRAARDAQVLAVGRTGDFHFRHALTRDAVLAELLPPERAPLAEAALSAILASHPDLEGDWCEVAVDLAVSAGDPGRAVGFLAESARRSLDVGAVARARGTLARARSLDLAGAGAASPLDALEAEAAALAGDVAEAIDLAHEALARLPPEDAASAAGLRSTLARALLGAGRWEEAYRESGPAVAAAETAADALAAARARAVGAQAAIALGDLDAARDLATRVVQDQAANAPAATCEAMEVLGRISRLDDMQEAEQWFERARAVASAHDLPLWEARALHELGTIDLFTTRESERLTRARAVAVDAGAPALVALVDLHLSSIGHARWDFGSAHDAAARCVDVARRLGLATLGMGLVHLASALAALGRDDECEVVCQEALETCGDEVDVVAGVPGRVGLMRAIRRGDMQLALDGLDEAIEILRREPATGFPWRGLWALLRTVLDTDERGREAREEARQAAGAGVPINRGLVRVADGVVEGRAGNADAAARAYEEGVADLVISDEIDGFRALVELIVAPEALRHGWGDGATWLRESIAVAEELGFPELASAGRAALRRAGEPVPRRGRGDSEVPTSLRTLGVTSREVDVLVLVADGLTNREIAARLSLSPRTVDRHVANLLTKTGESGRKGLARLYVSLEE